MKNLREGELVETFEGHEDGINCLALAADESVLVSGSEDRTARIWDLEDQPVVNANGRPDTPPTRKSSVGAVAQEEEVEIPPSKCIGVLK